jgi:hypothetical protein
MGYTYSGSCGNNRHLLPLYSGRLFLREEMKIEDEK